ncbi:very-long-chain 3-oxoacyl-CoA reductase 1-like [Aristolochia californica]|uniref:very-long-chain 3-oxoacyl-CoA reductase 1-like n=1 Tax=Aristolochia californica TaxID=171875 RepID=UPI0035D76843
MEALLVEQMRCQPFWVLFLSALGFVSLLKLCAAFLSWVFVTFLTTAKDLRSYGSWALITGPTDGIGKAFAFQLAQKGFHLILVGRNVNKLQEVSDAIQRDFRRTQIKKIALDFSSDLSDGVRRIKEAMTGLDVGILINNVGVSYPSATFFHEVDEAVWKNVVKVNIEGTTKVTLAVLPEMLKRKKGAVVNIGSGAATVVPSFPLYAVYAASKAYIDQLSRSLYVEYRESGIDVQCQLPLYVATKMVPFMKLSLFVPSPERFAQSALRRIGKGPRCTPYWLHTIQWCFARRLPEEAMDAWLLQLGMSRRKETIG